MRLGAAFALKKFASKRRPAVEARLRAASRDDRSEYVQRAAKEALEAFRKAGGGKAKTP